MHGVHHHFRSAAPTAAETGLLANHRWTLTHDECKVTPDIKIDPVTQFQRKPGDTTKCPDRWTSVQSECHIFYPLYTSTD